ncbi:MAG: NAD(P)/FAD-dependent oxidoreductase [Anaerolineales bacterium]
MARVLILGGGFGGVATAVTLRKQLGSSHEITLVDQRESFAFGFRKTWAFIGTSPMADGSRPLMGLQRLGIDVIRGTIESIEPANRSAIVDGKQLLADSLVVALGAQAKPGAVPGFVEHGVYFYDLTAVGEAHRCLQEFEGGRVAIVILGLPYPCPPAPYETALLMKENFAGRSLQAEIHVYSPQPMSLPVLGEAGCSAIEGRLAEAGIVFHPYHQVDRIESQQVVFGTGAAPFDFLIGIPVHASPEVVVASGLTEKGAWINVDPRTLETSHPDIYAVGDSVHIPLANGKALPKAGVFAEAQGLVVAKRIAAKLTGEAPAATFGGEGNCFLEVGAGKAMLVRGDFLAEPRPDVELLEASEVNYQAKLDFERTRLEAWFGEALEQSRVDDPA